MGGDLYLLKVGWDNLVSSIFVSMWEVSMVRKGFHVAEKLFSISVPTSTKKSNLFFRLNICMEKWTFLIERNEPPSETFSAQYFCPIDKCAHCYGSTWSLLPDHWYVNCCHVFLAKVKVLCNTNFSHPDGKYKHSERIIVGNDVQSNVYVCTSYLAPSITGSTF